MFDAEDLLDLHPRRKFEQMLVTRCAAGAPFALMLVHFDHFKTVAAQHGANVADLLLFEVSSRLRQRLSPRNVITRCGDSQFAVLVPGLEDIEKAKAVYGRLNKDYPYSPATEKARQAIIQAIGRQ